MGLYHYSLNLLQCASKYSLRTALRPELFLEYFYDDKYVTQNPPWLLVGKDVITALIYIKPLITYLTSGNKNFKFVK